MCLLVLVFSCSISILKVIRSTLIVGYRLLNVNVVILHVDSDFSWLSDEGDKDSHSQGYVHDKDKVHQALPII